MWEVVFVLLLPTIAPGLALTRILDASADSFRKGLLCFPIGLLALFGTSGLLFVVQMWSTTNLGIAILILNLFSIWFLSRKVQKERTKYTKWQKMEAAIHGVVLSESEPEIEHEVAAQQWFQNNRNPTLQIFAGCFCLLTLVPIFIFERPFGVDWIGFSTLATNVGQTGTFEVQAPNSGLWTYPRISNCVGVGSAHDKYGNGTSDIDPRASFFIRLVPWDLGKHGPIRSGSIECPCNGGLFCPLCESV